MSPGQSALIAMTGSAPRRPGRVEPVPAGDNGGEQGGSERGRACSASGEDVTFRGFAAATFRDGRRLVSEFILGCGARPGPGA